MATATKPVPAHLAQRRDVVAEHLIELLGDEPKSMAELGRALGYKSRSESGNTAAVIRNALAVLGTRGLARRIPDSPGMRGGWVAGDSEHASALVVPIEVAFDYEFDKLSALERWFIDESYQRPLTTFWKRIVKGFDFYLWGAPMLSDRGKKGLAIIDGQTRWVAANEIGITHAPAQIFSDLSIEDEAAIFWRVQRERRGVVSWYAFRAKLRSGDESAQRLLALVQSIGYEMGDGPTHLRAPATLEKLYATDDFLLERTLSAFYQAWPGEVPDGTHIAGLHFFFRHYPLEEPRKVAKVNDERLVERLKTAGYDGLHRRARAAKEVGGRGKGAVHMATAIQAAYLSGGGRA